MIFTGNVINGTGLETDLSSILEPASNTTTTETTAEAPIVFENNNSNASGESAANNITTETIQQQAEEQDVNDNEKMTIADTKPHPAIHFQIPQGKA